MKYSNKVLKNTVSSEQAGTVYFGREIHCSTGDSLRAVWKLHCAVYPCFSWVWDHSLTFCPVFSGKGRHNDINLISFYISLFIELESFPFQISNTNGNSHTWNTWEVY